MVLKLFKGVWFLSVLAVLANLLYVYASLPEDVVIFEGPAGRVVAKREFLFYAMTLVIMLINVLVYVIGKLYRQDLDLRAWFHGQVITINIFLIFTMSLVMVINSSEVYDFSRIGFSIYGSVALVILWAAGWPLYALYRKLFIKQPVLSK